MFLSILNQPVTGTRLISFSATDTHNGPQITFVRPDSGIFVPMYAVSTLPTFLSIMKADGPNVHYVIAVNPDSGPGTSIDSRFTNAISTMRSSGLHITILGYVPTGYGTGRTVQQVESMISSWHSFYPGIDGIQFDEVGDTSATDSFYKTITDYARASGANFLRANPGTSIDVGKIPMFDMIAIGESSSYPSMQSLASDTFNGYYGISKFDYTIHDTATLDTNWLKSARQYIGFVYITNDVEPNPYDTVPSYFAQEVSAVAELN